MSFSPSNPPSALPLIKVWIFDEFKRLASELQHPLNFSTQPIATEPAKPRNGMIVYADGVNFDPGGGEGFYGRVNDAWIKLHT